QTHASCAANTELTLCTAPSANHCGSYGLAKIVDTAWTQFQKEALPYREGAGVSTRTRAASRETAARSGRGEVAAHQQHRQQAHRRREVGVIEVSALENVEQ